MREPVQRADAQMPAGPDIMPAPDQAAPAAPRSVRTRFVVPIAALAIAAGALGYFFDDLKPRLTGGAGAVLTTMLTGDPAAQPEIGQRGQTPADDRRD